MCTNKIIISTDKCTYHRISPRVCTLNNDNNVFYNSRYYFKGQTLKVLTDFTLLIAIDCRYYLIRFVCL